MQRLLVSRYNYSSLINNNYVLPDELDSGYWRKESIQIAYGSKNWSFEKPETIQFGWRNISYSTKQSLLVVPNHPLKCGEFHIFKFLPWLHVADDLSLEKPVEGLHDISC